MEFLNYTFYGNSVKEWGLFLILVLVQIVVLVYIKRLIHIKLEKFAEQTKTSIDDTLVGLLEKTKLVFLLVMAVFFASKILRLTQDVNDFLYQAMVFFLLMQVAVWANQLISIFLHRYHRIKIQQDNASARASISAISFITKLLVWMLIIVLMLDNLGFNIKTLVAGLGVSGIAIALATQNILSDVFASFLIVLDKPFVIGDYIIVDSYMGTVEYIGLKTTRIRSLSGEQLIFANSDLLKSRIKNYKRMSERRIVFSFGVIYQTSAEQLEQIPGMVREIVEAQQLTRFDRCHFKSYGASSLDFETVYYVLDADYSRYMDIQEKINLALFRKFEENGLEFAYPTQTLFIEKNVHS